MIRRLMILLGWILGILGIAVVLAWLVLEAAPFASFRRSIVETALSEQIGQPLIVKDDVRVRLGRVARLYVSGVEIPSENIGNFPLAELNLLELDVYLVSLLQGKLDIDNLSVDGLLVNATTQQDGTTSWTPVLDPGAKSDKAFGTSAEGTTNAIQQEGNGSFLSFLNDKTASFKDIGLRIINESSGFDFDFDLYSLQLEQLEGGQLVSLTSKGTVNGETFLIDGKYPREKPFTTEATFGQLRLDFDGQPLTEDQGGGFSGTVTLDTGEFGEVLDILGLERVLEGNGRLSTDILRQSGVLKIGDLKTDFSLAGGQLITVNGNVGNLQNATGFDILVDARLHPEGKPPARAEELKDLELNGFSAHIISEGEALEFKDLVFTTNAFDQGLNKIGPVSIGRIKRSETGQLSLLDVTFQTGPRDDPYVVAQGDFKDVLQLKGLEFDGKLTAPASLVLRDLNKDESGAFGRVNADFAITDAAGFISLSKLHAYTQDTQLWSLEVQSAIQNVNELDGLEFSLDLDVPDGAAFLTALELAPVDVGALEITASANGQGKILAITASVTADESRLDAKLDRTMADGNRVFRGLISSKVLHIDDLKNAVAWVARVSSLSKPGGGDSDVNAGKPGLSADGKVEEPLVLGDKDDPETARAADPPDDGKIEEPLVLGDKDNTDTSDGKPSDLVDPAEMLAEMDLEIGIAIEKITGQQGVTSVPSDLAIKDAKARFGPLEFSYGGGYFNLSAAMDLIKSPELLNVSGATSGWDLGEILKTVGLGIDARGKLRGQFNITGNRKSPRTFINSMYGSATVSMSNGAIATSLMELAGLGIFPWLFSAELNQGYTNIVCAVAPMKIQGGKVSSNAIVVETASVQMIIAGVLDWRNDTISMRAEPRPVGRPLARSAWPINISGRLSKPDFKLQVGGTRAKRSDGATQSPAKRKPCTPDIQQLQ